MTSLDQEAMTCRLQEVRPRAPCALAAPMTRAIALTAPAVLGLSCASSHEPFHANGGQESMAATERSGQKPPQRRRDLSWSNKTVDQEIRPDPCGAELSRTWIKAAPALRRGPSSHLINPDHSAAHPSGTAVYSVNSFRPGSAPDTSVRTQEPHPLPIV